MATRLLPAVKRYAVSTEPVRDAARVSCVSHRWLDFLNGRFSTQFWTSFYERAAQVHIPTLEDYYEVDTQSQTSPLAERTLEATPSDEGKTPSHAETTTSEYSFMPTNAVSSTPARAVHLRDQTTGDQSWSVSLESPLVRLDRELQTFSLEEQEEASAYQDTHGGSASEEDVIKSNIDIKGKRRLPTPRARPQDTYVSPANVKSKTPMTIPKHIQVYLPPKSQPEPALPTPRRPMYQRSPHKLQPERWASTSTSSSALDIPSLTQQHSQPDPGKQFEEFNDSFDDSLEIMRGMSPPRTMAFARAPRSSIGLGLLLPSGRTPGKIHLPTLSRTPLKEAADRVRQDLLGNVLSQNANVSARDTREPSQISGIKDDTMSTIPTPPSLSRYTRHPYPSDIDETDENLEDVLRRVGMKMTESSSGWSSVASDAKVFSHCNSVMETLAPPDSQRIIYRQAQGVFHPHQDDQSVMGMGTGTQHHGSSDSDSDSLSDEPPQSGHPSTAFLMASAHNQDPDDSFASSSSNRSSDSLGGEYVADEVAGAPVHPFARAMEAGDGDGFDDSFDSVEADGELVGEVEETVFGIPPAQRQQGVRMQGELRMMGEELLQNTLGIGNQLAIPGESPTPLGRMDK